jgi:hypothetical protein|tara:strand:+ start:1373 stop:1573 length:201 start_codon:yes stop_codon:yes gene_type:complete
MQHIKVRNLRKHQRSIKESNGTTIRKEIRKTEVIYTRNGESKTGDEFLKSINPKLDNSIDWKNILK